MTASQLLPEWNNWTNFLHFLLQLIRRFSKGSP